MNAVEIEEAVSALAAAPFDAAAFPYAFLAAFGAKATSLKRLAAGATNASDVEGAVLQRNNIHLAACAPGAVSATLAALRSSPRTASAKAKFVLASDGAELEAEDLAGGATLACPLTELGDHFGFFLPLAGITAVAPIVESAFDVRATGRLNKLYVELCRANPEWTSPERRHDMNHFMARLIFCFFAEDTDIFAERGLFTRTVAEMSERDGGNVHELIGAIFRAMAMRSEVRAQTPPPRWADAFPYVNGGLFSGSTDAPRFGRTAKSYLAHIGALDWTKINPDIFGSMIQAVAEDEERGALGLHYTSVPNILKVLGPLFLDDLRARLEAAGDNPRALINLRRRIARIRVFDPACGSGNFLVIAYKEMRAIEAEILRRRRESGEKSAIPLTNFRGIELRDFPAEIARLALIIAEFQCDVLYRGQKAALARFLPLDEQNWITCGNALRLDWLSVCPPAGEAVKFWNDDLFGAPLDQAQVDFENAGGETYICGNPPYKGSQTQTAEQKADLAAVFPPHGVSSKQIDYVGGWFLKAAEYARATEARTALVSTNSICQGRIVPILWPLLFRLGQQIAFAYTSFKWANLASHNAGVTVVIVGMAGGALRERRLFQRREDGELSARALDHISPYLVASDIDVVASRTEPLAEVSSMSFGNMPVDGGALLLTAEEADRLDLTAAQRSDILRRAFGSAEFIRGIERYCLWMSDQDRFRARENPQVSDRLDRVRAFRFASKDAGTRQLSQTPHKFREQWGAKHHALIVPSVSSESRDYHPVGIIDHHTVVTNLAFALYDAPLWNMALIASRLHLVWIGTVCGKLKTDFRYSNTLGWNTFPVPPLTDADKAALTACAEAILLTREAHFPATIADLYDPDAMPADLRAAHEANDETLERIYIGRRFRNDTERLETLFSLYARMIAAEAGKAKPARKSGPRAPLGPGLPTPSANDTERNRSGGDNLR